MQNFVNVATLEHPFWIKSYLWCTREYTLGKGFISTLNVQALAEFTFDG